MAKRISGSNDGSPHAKRQRITRDSLPPLPKEKPVKIHNVRDLQVLLAFDQTTGPHVRQNIRSFQSFLDTVANGKESDERSSKRAVLLEYLQCQTVHENKDHSRFLTDIVRTWHFAVQTNVESLYASVAAVLALLLKTISDLIEFRDIGNQICQYLLLDDQVKLFDKGLWAIQAKEYLISPCLRLLTEIVSFDGGHAARTVFRQRETTFNRLEVFLSMRRDAHGGDAESRRRPPIRNIALRYFYANLRLQTPAAKRTMLTQGKIVRAIFEDLSEDSPDILLELLDVLKKEVASDDALPEYVKGRVFNEGTLSRLAVLYHYVEVEYASEGRKSIGDSVHNFLLFLCTSPGHGVLNLKERDPSTVENTKFEAATKMNHVRRSDDTFPTRNQTMDRNSKLASFLQSLRPYASVLHSELMIAVFYRAPELVSDYFVKKKSFSFDPKATTTWIGYSSFLLAIMRLPLPESLGVLKVNGGIPPSSKALISGIMPLPLTQKIMTRCLNQSVNLIKFIAINILSTAFEKLGKALGTCRLTRKDSISKPNSSAWNGLASDLITEFLNRIPDIGHVIAQFRRCSKTNNFLQESFTRLLALYHEILPQTALGAKLDVSLTLSAMLQESLEEGGVRRLELDHLLEIAFHSPSMQWWHKSEKMELSPFTTLLRLQVGRSRTDPKSQQFRTLLLSVIEENQVLHSNESKLSLDVLVLSLQSCSDWSPSSAVYEFLDSCILRLIRKPVHYYDTFSNHVAAAGSGNTVNDVHIDLLVVAVEEQWSHLAENTNASIVTNVAIWVIRYFEYSSLRIMHEASAKGDGRAIKILVQIRDRLQIDTSHKTCCSMLKRSSREPSELDLSIASVIHTGISGNCHAVDEAIQTNEGHSKSLEDVMPPAPTQEQEDHFGLNRWAREDIQDAVTDGVIEELFLCLCSRYTEIRQQALTSIGTFMGKLEISGYNAWRQTYIVAGELIETARDVVSNTSLPSLAAVLAASLLAVVADPLHLMYDKANKFLHQGVRWDLRRLPSYWIDLILLEPPTNDETHYQEVEWLLDILISGLRTSTDFDLYRGCYIFERLLSFFASSSFPKHCLQKISDLLFRCTYVEGGSTLTTRCAVADFVEASCIILQGSDAVIKAKLKTLAVTVYETSDQVRVGSWSDGHLERHARPHSNNKN